MAKKVRKQEKAQEKAREQAQEQVQAQEQAQEQVQEFIVNGTKLINELGLNAIFGADPDEAAELLNATTRADDNGTEWATAWIPYSRVDGRVVPGLTWAVAWRMDRKITSLVLRLVERGGGAKVTATAYANGKMRIRGALAQALVGAWGLKEWGDDDVAALL